MLRFLFIFSPALLLAQVYSLSFYGLPVGRVEMKTTAETIFFSARSHGVLDFIWPFQNEYETTFMPGTFTVKEYEKTVRQGATDFTLACAKDEAGIYTWTGGDTLRRPQGIENIFSLLARVQSLPVSEIDTKWYVLDHEGKTIRARLLWADSVRVYARSDSISCDYYRLDIKQMPGGKQISEEQDYFMKYIPDADLVRQLWVEKRKPHRIVKALVSRGPLKLEALLQNE